MKIKAFISVSLLLLLLICAAPVYAVPALPHAFYGSILINGTLAPAGTQVTAVGTGVMTGVPQNPLTTTAAGQYGNGGAYLLVQGDIQDGATVNFYINGVPTEQTAKWHSAVTTQLNLSVIIAPSVGGGGGGPLTLDTNLFGTAGSFNTSSAGVVQSEIKSNTADGKLTIDTPKGTTALDKDGNPLTSMTGIVNPNPPAPPANANVIGLAYTFGPAGATFNPPITMTYVYDPATLPAGVAEQNLVIAYYNTATSTWVELPCTVNAATHTITAQVSHFSIFAILGKLQPAAFTVSSLSVSPGEVAPDDKVNIVVAVANTGGIKGDYTVVLNINNLKEAESSVTIAGGSSQTVTFTVSKDKAGSYSVTVGGKSGSFTVTAPTIPATTAAPTAVVSPPTILIPTTEPAILPPATTTAPTTVPPVSAPKSATDWLLIWEITGGVVVVGLILFFLIRTIVWRRQG